MHVANKPCGKVAFACACACARACDQPVSVCRRQAVGVHVSLRCSGDAVAVHGSHHCVGATLQQQTHQLKVT